MKVTVDTMKKWLALAYAETDATGQCSPSKYKIPGGSNTLVAAGRLGIIEKHGGSSRWADMSNPPYEALAQELLDAYTAYRKKCEANTNGKATPAAIAPDDPAPVASVLAILNQLEVIEKKIDALL